jgi:hypothetical protein
MFARLTRFKADPSACARLEQLTREALLPLFREQPGFQRLQLLEDHAEGRFAGLSYWDSREAAEAAGAVIDSSVKGVLAGLVDGKLRPRLFEVFEP